MIFNLNKEEEKKLLSLFSQHENNIDYLIHIKSILGDVSSILNGFDAASLKDKDPLTKKTALVDAINKTVPTDNTFINKNLKWDTHHLSIDEYNHNPYLQTIKNIKFNKDGWSLESRTIKAYQPFINAEETAAGGNAIIRPSLGFFDKDYVYPSISLEGNEWMSLNPHEIKTMEIAVATSKGKVLTLGLGLGYFAYMAHLKEEVKEVHIVEMDLELIKLFQEYLLPLFPHKEKIHIHKADAFEFIKDIKDRDYDFIFSDLWHDVSDGLPSYIKLIRKFDSFTYTQRSYWIEESIITYLRLFVIGVMKDEYNHLDNDYDDIQRLIKKNAESIKISGTYELDALLSYKGLKSIVK